MNTNEYISKNIYHERNEEIILLFYVVFMSTFLALRNIFDINIPAILFLIAMILPELRIKERYEIRY